MEIDPRDIAADLGLPGIGLPPAVESFTLDDLPDYLRPLVPEVQGEILGAMVVPPEMAPMLGLLDRDSLTLMIRTAAPLLELPEDFAQLVQQCAVYPVVNGELAVMFYVKEW